LPCFSRCLQRAAGAPSRPGARHCLDCRQRHRGGLVVVRVTPGTSLTLDGETVPLSDDGHAMIGFHRDSDSPVRLQVKPAGAESYLISLDAAQREYVVQRIDGLKRDHVTPPKEVLERIGADSAAVRAARARHDAGAMSGDFLRGL
jgi:hypothetical protein